MSKESKVNLTLLKKLVVELEEALTVAESVKAGGAGLEDEYVIEMSKASGLASGVMQESALLVMDILHLVKGGALKSPVKDDLLNQLLGPIKGTGTN